MAGSAKGSPGATTAMLALALTWPRPTVLIEADLAGGDLRAGFLQTKAPAARDLLGFALATRRGPANVADFALAVEDGSVWVVPGLTDPSQREAVLAVWPQVVASANGVGRDVFLDAGRLDSGWSLVSGAQPSVILLVLAPTLAGVDRAYPIANRLRDASADGQGAARLGLLAVGDGPYSPSELAAALELPVLGVLPADDRGAQALSAGRIDQRSLFLRAARGVASELARSIDPSGDLLTAGVLR
jgi:hypothetical protein